MAEKWRTERLVTSAPVYVAVGVAWLAAILWIVIGNIILRETALGRLARQIDRLPPVLARPVFVLCWCLFFLGWTAPLFVGLKRLFRRNEDAVSR